MSNTVYNKVTVNGTTLMDITDTTATAADVASGKYFYPASGVKTAGTWSAYTLEEINTLGFPPVSGDVVFSGTRVKPYFFANNTEITSFTGNNVTSLSADGWGMGAYVSNAFANCSALLSVTLPLITSFNNSDYCFQNCTALQTVNVDWSNITHWGTSLFSNCPALTKTTYVLPKLVSNIWVAFLTNNSNVTAFDIGSASLTTKNLELRSTAFSGDSNLNLLILRQTQNIRVLKNIDAFKNTPFASGGSGGTLYVPSSLVSEYQSATNWSTILGYANNQIKAIEGSTYETHYADGTTIPTS